MNPNETPPIFQVLRNLRPEAPGASEARARQKAEEAAATRLEALRRGGYTPRAISAAREATGPAIEKARAILPRILEDGLFLLLGNTGRGKTVMATWLAMQRQQAGMKCGRFLTAFQMFAEVKATFSKGQDITAEALVFAWSRTPFLVIDEIQTRTGSAWEDGVLDEVVNARYGAMLPTILIGNLALKEAQQALGARIMDRAREAGGIVDCSWNSYREAGK